VAACLGVPATDLLRAVRAGERRLFRKIQMIDDATTDQDLRVPPSNHFEKLRGNLQGFHSIRVNKQWLISQWDGGRGEASGVSLDDHGYR
jgi:toxin HigB-1